MLNINRKCNIKYVWPFSTSSMQSRWIQLCVLVFACFAEMLCVITSNQFILHIFRLPHHSTQMHALTWEKIYNLSAGTDLYNILSASTIGCAWDVHCQKDKYTETCSANNLEVCATEQKPLTFFFLVCLICKKTFFYFISTDKSIAGEKYIQTLEMEKKVNKMIIWLSL